MCYTSPMNASTIITTTAALLGIILGSVLQHWLVVSNRRVARRAEIVTAVSDLSAALSKHRKMMWLREKSRLDGDTATHSQVKLQTMEAASAAAAPLAKVQILAPVLSDVAKNAVLASNEMRGSTDEAGLNVRRERAVLAADALVLAASREI